MSRSTQSVCPSPPLAAFRLADLALGVDTALDSNNFDQDYKRRQIRADRPEKGVDADEGRKARSEGEMRVEAERLASLFPEDVRGTFE